jgi:MarR family transcriptional regulator, organic hydroperoxide resistance regulator
MARAVDEEKAPDDRRLFFLINRAQHAVLRLVDRRCAAELGVSSTQVGALFYLAKHDGCLHKELAAALGQNASAVTGLVGRMMEAGLLERRADATDGRATHLHLSARGRRILAAARPLLAQLNQLLTAGFTPAEIEVVARFLRATTERSEKASLEDSDDRDD